MTETELQTIPKIRAVYYDTYANLPTSNLQAGDLGYATDRLVLYRWSGAAWQATTFHSSSGVAANIPNAADLPDGSLYYETDTAILKQVQSSAWATIGTKAAIDTTLSYTRASASVAAGATVTCIAETSGQGVIFAECDGIGVADVEFRITIDDTTVKTWPGGTAKQGSVMFNNKIKVELVNTDGVNPKNADGVKIEGNYGV